MSKAMGAGNLAMIRRGFDGGRHVYSLMKASVL